MGKVKSFFRVLACPKKGGTRSTRTRAQDKPSNEAAEDTSGHIFKKNISVDEEENFSELRGDNFSFSAIVNSTDAVVQQPECAFANFNQQMSIECPEGSRQHVAIFSLCNILLFKIKQDLLLALFCLHRQSMRVHLRRQFVKKIAYVFKRNLENSARHAVITLRRYRMPLQHHPKFLIAITRIENNLEKPVVRNVQASFQALRNRRPPVTPPGSTSQRSHAASEGKRQGSIISSKPDSAYICNKSLGVSSTQLTQGYQPRSNTTGTSRPIKLNDLARHRASTLSGNGAVDANGAHLRAAQSCHSKSASTGPSVTRDDKGAALKCVDECIQQDIHNKTDCSSSKQVDKKKIGNSIFQNAIKGAQRSIPAVAEQKTNIIWELDFFTCEPYVSYAYKSIRCSSLTRNDAPVSVTVTPNALQRLKFLTRGNENRSLVVSVTGGGCSGFQYNFKIVDDTNDLRCIYDSDNCMKVFSDDASLELIDSCTIDYQNNLVGSKFVLDNIRNLSKRCSCGNSFDIKD
ncbi:Iron-sulphur cluster biosynthesis domain containing protein, putative [Babesia bigemina]|uniref:Iron-sulphur cluster biosynthesis domain containing protein, putative n=1 Tax=Babesia bigemina TaxID=5866 RepID=A0A061D831_BABBI|nr:Iron-sulphur cluster biosynthesis domain containing protein, putative [Babesia bigemina]CDR96816.1 Iron-sulphur cluster biosynthesis domain containing protein, putative [Babesia bigemina]|eukprot:XP_012769002.1 Iron-sulphur cluster biosynthesis domain containing protein, putative [Babesia bigemina]